PSLRENKLDFPSFHEVVICPYDRSHRVLRGRMSIHLVHCRGKDVNPDKFLICPFNSSHRVCKWKIDEHVEKCVNRSDIWEVTPDESPKTDQKKSVPCEADWDDDEDVPTYTPNLMEKENFVVRAHYGLSRDDGRKFREEERKRFALWQE
ncbi:hypothetical protein KR067_008457, partial [Drosophila pandora]